LESAQQLNHSSAETELVGRARVMALLKQE
jgi:hypothetical protein